MQKVIADWQDVGVEKSTPEIRQILRTALL